MKIAWRIFEIIIKILAFILGLVGILVMLFIATFYYFDLNEHKPIIEQQFQAITGNTLILKGPITITLSPVPTFHFRNASVEVKSFRGPLMVSAEQGSFKITLHNLFSNGIHLYDIKGKNISLSFPKNNTPSSPNKDAWKKRIEQFNGKLDVKNHIIDLTKLKIKMDNQNIEGKIHIIDKADQMLIQADVTSPEWIVDSEKSSNILSFLTNEKVIGKLKWQCKTFVYNDFRIQQALFQISKDKQGIEIEAQGHMPGADITSDTTATDIKSQPKITTDVTMDVTDPQVALKLSIPNVRFSATGMKINLKGKSQGSTIEEIKKNFQGELKGKAETVVFKGSNRDAVIKNVAFQLKKETDQFHIESTGSLPGASYKGDFWIKQWPEQPSIITDVHINADNAATFLQSIHPSLKLQGGTMVMHLQGKTEGHSFEDWKKGFKGHLFLHVQQLMVLEQAIDARLVDVFALFWHMFVPSAKQTLFECVATRFWVHNGILLAEDNFAIETPDIYALGTGSIDFNRQWLGLSFDVYPRSKLPLQLGAYDNMVSIRGPMSAPNVSTSANGLIAKGGSIALGIATSGLSTLIEKFIQVINHKGSPCAKVLSTEKQDIQPSLQPSSTTP